MRNNVEIYKQEVGLSDAYYDPQMRRLQGLQAKNQSVSFMDNAYSFDDVGNILGVSNNATAGAVMGGQMNRVIVMLPMLHLNPKMEI